MCENDENNQDGCQNISVRRLYITGCAQRENACEVAAHSSSRARGDAPPISGTAPMASSTATLPVAAAPTNLILTTVPYGDDNLEFP
ncbi:hypothetical protein MSAN_00576000 [Mycena sanguinolenta]|uniref:Uncharacterized protein n=1 Tax=Mycena sanguinolenta TaxID=230812 RepID=A0A8H6Z6V5_9AGAR|nr:hypothetical protein MSAN_00576000 [Mycena sanguinolenta]